MNFDSVKFWIERTMEIFNIKGGVILGLFSLEILAMIPYHALTKTPFPEPVRDIYLGVIAAFAATNVAKHYAVTRNMGGSK